jgi:cephalosporin-C deacetylase-like acetyl esterase
MRGVLWTVGIVIGALVFVGVVTLFVLAFRGEDFLTERIGKLEHKSRSAIGSTELYLIDSVVLRDDRGLEVRGYLRIPKSEGPHPVVVLMAGLNTGRESLDWVMDVPETRHVAFLTLDYPYQGKTHFETLEFLQNLGPIYQALFDGVNAGVYARQYLSEIPEIDSSRIFIVGVSFGAFYSVVAGALDPGFRMVGAFFGGADFAELLDQNMKRQGMLNVTFVRRLAARIAATVLHPLEPTLWAGRISPRPFLMINGEHDNSIPRENVLELYESAGEPKKLIWIRSMHIDLEGPAIVPELVGESAVWLQELGLLEPAEVVATQ